MIEPPYFPIIYVRGYAGSQAEVEDTVATPYMGFNLGSTKFRQQPNGDVERWVFESPLIRLMKNKGYSDVYENGAEIPGTVPAKSVWIYRYYESVSQQLGTGVRPEIEAYATGLHQLIEQVRAQVCGDDAAARAAFRVHLVAHSMGGLIVRCYLQNICPKMQIQPPVDKVFTYATPHGGIDFRVLGNVPRFLALNNIETFNVARMREYLKLDSNEDVRSLGGHFDPARVFCLIGTNARDYAVAMGLSSLGTGPMGDGLVQIRNAYTLDSPRAFVHRSHSGHFGIVNSEEGYQNLERFLFGRVQVDGFLDIDKLTLPPNADIKKAAEAGRLRAGYHIEVVGRVRKARWDLHRRLVDEQSALFLTYDEIQKRRREDRPIQLFSTFLEKDSSDAVRRNLGFSIDLRVQVPDYRIDNRWRWDDYYDGGFLYREKINLLVAFGGESAIDLRYGFDSSTPNRAPRSLKEADVKVLGDGQLEFRIPVEWKTRPGLSGTLVIRSKPWS